MKIKFRFEDGVLSLPSAVIPHLREADATALRVLLLVSSAPELTLDAIGARLGISPEAAEDAIDFWRGAGVIAGARKKRPAKSVAPEPPAEKPEGKHAAVPPRSADEIPDYSTGELSRILAGRQDMVELLEECERAWGKIFNTHEINVLVGIMDFLGFDGEYLLVLLDHAAKLNYRSLHSVEKLAFRLREEEIDTVDALQERMNRMEAARSMEGKIRSLFGLGSRSFTEKERNRIDLWVNTYHFGEDMIRLAFETAVDRKGNATVSYVGGILKNWHDAGLTTPAAAREADEAFRASREAEKKPTNPARGGVSPELSSMGDDFWEAAVRASYGEDYERLGLGKSKPGNEKTK